MTDRILFVDDEPNVLAGYERQFRKRYAVEIAPGGAEGLAALDSRGPFAVIVSDLRMPGVDGVQFLATARERQPDAIRMLLTGYADLQQAIEVVNRGSIFRFLTKPCPLESLTAALDAALTQHRLVSAERELLDRTLRGSVQVLGEVLALVNPTAFGQVIRVQRLVRELGSLIEGGGAWEIDVAAVLSRLGCVAIPESLLAASNRGAPIGAEDQRRLGTIPSVTRDLLKPIPRLERVTEIIDHLDKSFGIPGVIAALKGKSIPLGSRLLKVAFDYDTLVARGVPKPQALAHLQSRAGAYDPDILAALESLIVRDSQPCTREVWVGELAPGMILIDAVYSDTGVLLLSPGHPITDALKHRLEALATHEQTPKRFRVQVPPGA